MDVKNAIALMAKNPLVNFPWEGTLIGLVNGFLPEGSQLDPNTATAADVTMAIDSLEVTLQDMVYTSHIGPGQAPYVAPVAPTPPQAPATPQLSPEQTNQAAVVNMRNTMYKMFGALICVIALYFTLNVGNGTDAKDVVEVLKAAISLMKESKSGAETPETP